MFKLRAFSLSALCVLFWHCPAEAQEGELQDRLELYLPEPSPVEPPTRTVVTRRTVPAEYKTELVAPPPAEKFEILQQKGLLTGAQVQAYRGDDTKQVQSIDALWNRAGRPGEVRRSVLVAPAREIEEKKVERKPPQLKLSLPNTANFTSNAFNSRINEVHDRNFVFSPRLTYTLPLTGTDEFAFEVTSSSTRFDQSKALENDTLVGNVRFSHFFAEGEAFSRFFPGPTKESLNFGLETNSTFGAGYEGSARNAYIPSVAWSIAGIPLSTAKCGGVTCFTAGLGAGVDFTSTDYDDADYASYGGSATFGWAPGPEGLSISLSAALRHRMYDRLPVERDDLFGRYGAEIKWVTKGGLTFAGKVEYVNRDSTSTAAEYETYLARPSFALSMPLN